MPALRSSRFLFWMARLALLAVLLLALMPTVSRWMQGRTLAQSTPTVAADVAAGGMHDMHDMHSMHGMHGHADPSASGAPPMPMGGDHGDACAYCPLLASLAPVLLALILLLPLRPQGRLPVASAQPARAFPRLRGLGARGPPILL